MKVLKLAPLILIPLLCAFITYQILQAVLFSPMVKGDVTPVVFEIPNDANGSSVRAVSEKLAAQKLTGRSWSLSLLARLRKEVGKPFVPGEYELNRGMSPKEILVTLRAAKKMVRTVTIDPGDTMFEVAAKVELSGIMSKADFTRALTDRNTLIILGIRADSFEGYLFPATYQFSKPIAPHEMVSKIMTEGENNWSRDFNDRVEKLKMNAHEMLTLASIVQKEAISPESMPMIAAVLSNRIKEGLKLQVDSTVRYGMENPPIQLTNEDRQVDNPYNTFLRFGLPPGPICNPGIDAIRAVLNPAETSALYFLRDGAGGYIFTQSEREYQEALGRVG